MSLDWNQPDFAFLRRQFSLGRIILFAGAGFSVSATNENGQPPPLGGQLAELLAAEAGFPYSGEPLAIVYETVQRQIGTSALWTLLRRYYDIHSFAEWYRILKAITWHRIYTTNIDNLFQKLYTGKTNQRLHSVVNPSPIEERDPLFGQLQCIHLHGHVDSPEKGLSFTLPDFGNLTAKPDAWYQMLADDVYSRPVLFIGTHLEEPMFHHYLNLRDPRDREQKEFRPKSFLVNPTIGQIRGAALKERNIAAVECTTEEFLKSLEEEIGLGDFSLSSVRSRAFPYAVFREGKAHIDERVNRHFDLIRPDALPFMRSTRPDDFFMGAEPDWSDIAENRDAIRAITQELLEHLPEERKSFSCVILHGPAGSGKTTTLMRTAQALATSGAQVYYAKGMERLELSGILELAAESGETRIFIFIDVFSRHLAAIDFVRDHLKSAQNVTLVLAERTNKYVTMNHSVLELQPIELQMPDLNEQDVRAILAKLRQFGFLGVLRDKTPEQQVAAFIERANKQLLVALREATSGKGFDIILRSEYEQLAAPAKLAYTICCIAVAHGAPGVYTRHLMPCLGRTEFKQGVVIRDLLRGVLVPANDSETMVKPRHRLIAYWVATEIAPAGQKVEAISKFLKQISSDIVPNEIKRRSPAYLAYRGMINSEHLKETFSNDSEIIIGLYDELKPYYDHDFLFWLQYGMANINGGRLDVAENYLNQSIAIYPNSHQTKHHLGCLYLMQATRSLNPATAIERANDGKSLLIEQIHTHGDEDSYPYHAYLTHVCRWYERAGSLISQKDWEELRRVGTEAQKKYARDDMIRKAALEVERQYLLRVAKDEGE